MSVKFSVSTNVLKSATKLVVIKGNVSSYYRRSGLLQVALTSDGTLTLNTESYNIKSKVVIRGKFEGDSDKIIFVDNLLFSSLLSTVTGDVVSLLFEDNFIEIIDGNTKLRIPKLVDSFDVVLEDPSSIDDANSSINIEYDSWEFIHKHHASMIGASTTFQVYRNIWIGDGTVLSGDKETGLFIKSNHDVGLISTCLISDMILNIILSAPENSTLSSIYIDDSHYKYIISSSSDSYDYISEFTPLYESDDTVGSYHSDTLLNLMETNNYITISLFDITQFLRQIKLLGNAELSITLLDSKLHLESKGASCDILVTDQSGSLVNTSEPITFSVSTLSKALSNFGSSDINISLAMRDNDIVGLNLLDGDLIATIGRI